MDTRVSVFPDNEAAIRSLAGFVTNYRIVRNCRRCVDLLSGHFSVSLIWVPVYSNIMGKSKADELARTGALLPESSTIELGMPLATA